MKRKKFKVKIDRRTWTIKFGKTWRGKNGKRVWGQYDWDTRTITLWKKAKGLMLLDTLIHEVRHVQDDKYKERYINWQATDLAKVLKKLGYKRKRGKL